MPGHVQTDIYKNMKAANVPNDKVVASLPVKAMEAASMLGLDEKTILLSNILIWHKIQWVS